MSNYKSNGTDIDDLLVRREYADVGYPPAGRYYIGYNYRGQAGDGTARNAYSTPIRIGSDTDWIVIAPGYGTNYFGHSAYLKDDGTLWTSGYNAYGQLGIGSTISPNDEISSPVQVGTDTDWKNVSAGEFGCFALKTNGTLWGWGNTWVNGSQKSTPTQIGSDTDWSEIVGHGKQSAYVVKSDGLLWSWGLNFNGWLGDGSITNRFTPVQPTIDMEVRSVMCGDTSTLVVDTGGKLWGAGVNLNGKLGLGSLSQCSTFIQIGSDTDWLKVATTLVSSIAIKTDGTLWSTGAGTSGQLGNGSTTNISTFVQVGALTDWLDIEGAGGGSYHALKTDGTLWAWGANGNGQIGDGTYLNTYSSPVLVSSDTGWIKMSGGAYYMQLLYI